MQNFFFAKAQKPPITFNVRKSECQFLTSFANSALKIHSELGATEGHGLANEDRSHSDKLVGRGVDLAISVVAIYYSNLSLAFFFLLKFDVLFSPLICKDVVVGSHQAD